MSAPSMPPPAPHAVPHPGWQPAATPPGRGLGYAVMAVAVAVTLMQIATAVLAGPAAERFARAIRAGGSSFDVYTTYDTVGAVTVFVQVVAFVLTGLWLLRLRRFSERVQPTLQHSRRRWWAFGGWVVPIVSFWFPFQYVRDVRDGLRPFGWAHGKLVGWWWTAFLVAQFIDGASGNVASGETVATVRALPGVEWTQAVACAVALVLWLLVVRRLQRSVDEVPAEVLQRTAYAADPEAYDHRQAPMDAPMYGPGPLPPAVSQPAVPPPAPSPPPHRPGAGAG